MNSDDRHICDDQPKPIHVKHQVYVTLISITLATLSLLLDRENYTHTFHFYFVGCMAAIA